MAVRSSKVHGEIVDITNSVERKDRISDLPEAILCHILSFMPTRNAIQTGILSTRWKSLWTSVPVMHIEDRVGKTEDGPGSFINFVNRFLLLHNSPNLYKFLLRCRDCGARNPYHLCSLTFLHKGMFNKFLSGCPALEELEIYSLPWLTTLRICSSSLKKLIIYNRGGPFVQHKLVIKAPSLETLELDDESSTVYAVDDELPALVKAIFHVGPVDYLCSYGYRNAAIQMLAKASNVQHLRLSDQALKAVISASAYNQLLFCSLTHLDIGIRDIPLSGVADLLGRIPGLRVLVLNKTGSSAKVLDKATRKCSSVCLWTEAPENVPTCLSLGLEKIEFHGLSWCKHEMKLVRYLLENAMVLKKLTLHSWSRNEKLKTELQMYYKNRGSSTCQIEFHHKLSSVKWLF